MAVKTRRAEFPPHFGGNLRFDSQARSAGWELARRMLPRGDPECRCKRVLVQIYLGRHSGSVSGSPSRLSKDACKGKPICLIRRNMTYNIREISKSEYKVLEDFLYEAIFIPEGVEAPPKEIIYKPELQVYIKDFGTQNGDYCLVAEVNNKIVGAVWVRIMNDYGHIDNQTPSFAISIYKDFRNNGIGTALMKNMLALLKNQGYKRASLAVQKANYAVKMYKNVGFEIIDENDEEYIMICDFMEDLL